MSRDELTLYFSNLDGPVAKAVIVLFTGLPAALALWLLFLSVNQLRIMAGVAPSEFNGLRLVADPTTPWQVIGAGTAALAVILTCGLLAVRFSLLGWRSTRKQWWLRLSPVGFEINDRIFHPRRFRWAEIDGFWLMGTDGQPLTGPVAQVQTVGDVLRDGAAPQSGRVTFRVRREDRRWGRRHVNKYVMGWWDRPFDEAVDLMNDWLTRHR